MLSAELPLHSHLYWGFPPLQLLLEVPQDPYVAFAQPAPLESLQVGIAAQTLAQLINPIERKTQSNKNVTEEHRNPFILILPG